MSSILSLRKVSYSYRLGTREVEVLKNLDLDIQKGDFVGILGPSGSGKSTLFYILGCLLKPRSGSIQFQGHNILKMPNPDIAYLRNQKIGFIFQHFHLLPKATVLENILLPVQYNEQDLKVAGLRAKHLAKTLGLEEFLDRFPNQLSGGQQQRVAIARALMNDVDLLLADEPTGNLDSKTAAHIMDLLSSLNAEGKTIVLITHDSEVAKRCRTLYQMRDGRFVTSTNTTLESSGEAKSLVRPQVSHWVRMKSIIPLAFESLRHNRVRSLLTMLGVMIGIASVFSMITFGNFTKRKILESYEAMGANKLFVYGYPNHQQKAKDVTANVFRGFKYEKDIIPLKRIFPEIVKLSPINGDFGSSNLTFGGRTLTTDIRIVGVSEEYLEINNRSVTQGRPLSEFHVQGRSPVCVIGPGIVEKLFLGIQPVGQILFIGSSNSDSYPCKVIGVLNSQSSSEDWWKPNYQVLMPYTYFQAMTRWGNRLNYLSLSIDPERADIEQTTEGLKNFFKSKYGNTIEIGVSSDDVLVAQMKKFLTLFALLLSFIALVTLAVGGIGINNMMLVSLAERFKEIGIRKAVGATDKLIRTQLLLEACVLCAFAGLVGVLVGLTGYQLMIYGASQFVSKMKFEWVFDPIALTVSLTAILIVGIASGIVPALRAEKLEVIEALRTE